MNENDFNVGTLMQPPICGIHDATMYWDCASNAWICQQCVRPVASPQATRPDAKMQTRILDAAYAQQKRMECAAQPAAGTTPMYCPTCGSKEPYSYGHSCLKNADGWHRANWSKSEGTTPQAERPTPEMVIDICRELYDRFAMGGWEPQDAYPWLTERLGL